MTERNRNRDNVMRRLYDHHRVAETEKPIPLPHRLPINAQALFPSYQSGYEHDECAFGQMKVGDERVHTLEFVRRIDKNGRIAAARAQKTVFVRDCFERPHGRSADGDDSPPFALGGIHDIRRLFPHAIVFGVHDVVRQILFFDGAESPRHPSP